MSRYRSFLIQILRKQNEIHEERDLKRLNIYLFSDHLLHFKMSINVNHDGFVTSDTLLIQFRWDGPQTEVYS